MKFSWKPRMIPLYSLLGHQSLEKNISVDLHILCPLLVSQKGILKANAIHLAKSARQSSMKQETIEYYNSFTIFVNTCPLTFHLNSIEPPTYLLIRFNLYKWGFLFLPWVHAYPLKFSMEGFV